MTYRIKRIIPIREVAASEWYQDMADLARIFDHDVIADDHGTWRWQANDIVRWTVDKMNSSEFCNLNELWTAVGREHLDPLHLMKFYMQMGYSLCGYAEVFGQCEATDLGFPKRPGKPGPAVKEGEEYWETPIEHVRRVHKGKKLHF